MLVLRRFLDTTRVDQLARDNRIGISTAYRYLHEGIDVLAAVTPGLRGVLLAARIAGHSQCTWTAPLSTPTAARPSARPRTWTCGGRANTTSTAGNIQVVTAPDGWPLWVSDVRPGREHDLTCARTHPGLLDALNAFTDPERVVPADLGYLGEADRLTAQLDQAATGKTSRGVGVTTVSSRHHS